VNASQSPKSTVRPLISEERMREILSSRRSISSEEFKKQVEAHLGRPHVPARKPVSFNGQTVWVSC
jgi:hypothetical protein